MKIINAIRHKFYGIAKVLAFVVAAILVYVFIPRGGKFNYEYQLSKPWQHETLYAPFDFPIFKDEKSLRLEREAVLRNVNVAFSFDETAMLNACESLSSAFETQWGEGQGQDKEVNLDCLFWIFDTIENQGVVAHDKHTEGLTPTSLVTLLRNKEANSLVYGDFYTIRTAETAIDSLLAMADDRVNKNLVGKLLKKGIRQNVFYSADLTKRMRDDALASVSLTSGMVQRGTVIVEKGNMVDATTYAILDSLVREHAARELAARDAMKVNMSRFFLVSLVFALMGLYLNFQYKEVFSELRNVVVLLLFVVMVVLPSYLISGNDPSYVIIIPVTIVGVMVGAFFTLRLAFSIQFFTIMLISLAVPNPFQYVFMQMTAAMVVIFSMSKQRIRHRISLTALLIFASYVVMYVAFAMLSVSKIKWFDVGMLALNALFTMLAQPLISVFERLFRYTTSVSLMELSNTNSPLLRELSKKAPGTFQHSIQVANLCEEVLIEIGGDSVLARTGALYHDVGKTVNPLYFTENQQGSYNPHEELSYEESAQIIIAHVIKGIELAHKAHIPECVVDFIRTHHGTRRTDYFYIMEQKEHPDEEIDPAPFSYHGPIPFSRETAVLMMCDSIEAASHSIKEPNEKNISELVDNIINKQMESGQFLNTDLTLRDFETIRKVLKKKMMSIYHVRIAYPSK